MATYTQWAGKKKVSRVAWVCGPQRVLHREVKDAYRQALPAVSPVVLWAEDWPDHGWDYLLTLPLGPRLALVMNAQDLRSLDALPALLDDAFDGCFTVFFSAEDDFRRTETRPGDKKSRELIPPLAALRDSRHGQIVRCADIADDETKVALVAEWWGCGRNLAAGLLAYSNGSLHTAREVVRKARLAGMPPTEDTLRILADRQAVEDYAYHLIAGNRKEAMQAAAVMSVAEFGEVLPLLASRVGTLNILGAAARAGRDLGEEARRLRLEPFLVKLLRPHAQAYDTARVQRCREVLALAESSWRAGARDGLAEAVAALW